MTAFEIYRCSMRGQFRYNVIRFKYHLLLGIEVKSRHTTGRSGKEYQICRLDLSIRTLHGNEP